jgi:hypothetical protein
VGGLQPRLMNSLISWGKTMKLAVFGRAVLASFALAATASLAQTFEPIIEPQCINPSYFGGWTTGGLYTDPAYGVPLDQWSLMAMWQGSDYPNNHINYDIGNFTGLHGVPSYGQRGRVPEDVNGSPGAQVQCMDVGMLVNTWDTPHRPIIGGGYNDIWGYAWSQSNRVYPFVENGAPTELVVQANIALPIYDPNTRGSGRVASGQVVLFAYLRDMAHPSLHPIAMLAAAYNSAWTQSSFNNGFVAYDYSNNDIQAAATSYPNWYGGMSGNGVWFSSGEIGANTPYITTRYTVGLSDAPLSPRWNLSAASPFFRAHFTQQNLLNLINAIQANPCAGPPNCPAKGYSTNPADYALEYAGVIAESTLTDGQFDVSATNWVPNDPTKDQVSLTAHIYAFGVYRYVP